MLRGGKRSTSFKPGQSGNPRGRPRKSRAILLKRALEEEGYADSIKINLQITRAGAAELCRRGLVTPGYETHPQAVAHGLLEAAARYLGLKSPWSQTWDERLRVSHALQAMQRGRIS
jgi:Family of unknown function (DUF5681)